MDGHTHHPVVNTAGPVHYFNSGCWTERPCTYLTIEDGRVELHTYRPANSLEEVDAALARQTASGGVHLRRLSRRGEPGGSLG